MSQAGGQLPLCFIVDDHEPVRRIIAHALSGHGIRFREFGSVRALSAGLAGEQPDLIFLDLKLEDSDAVAAIDVLKRAGFTGRLQIISGRPPDLLDAVRQIYERHGFAVLPPLAKPFRRAAVEGALAMAGLLQVGDGPPPQADHSGPAGAGASRPGLLEEALLRGWLTFQYQPKVDFRRDEVTGAETLARIRHPDLGLIAPGDFLPQASEDAVDRLAEKAVACALADWEYFHARGRNLRLSVNVPLSSLMRLPLAALVREKRPKHADWPGLIVEVKERDAAQDLLAIQQLTTQLRIYDVFLAIDNLGHASIAGGDPRAVALAEMKLDRSLVAGCSSNRANRRICRAVVELAHSLNAFAVGEGIEDADDLRTLVQLACDAGQGNLFSPALAREDLVRLLAERSSWLAGFGVEVLAAPRGAAGSPATLPAPLEQLTQRESEVMQYVVKGRSSKEAAVALGLSPRTVEVHRARIMAKLGARNIADLVRIALAE